MNRLRFLPSSELADMEAKANDKLAQLHKHSHILGKQVLNVVKKEATLIQSPLEDEEFCAFVCQKQDRLFVYLNSYLPADKQHFAAAHELYHIWFDRQFLQNPEMLSSHTLNDETDDDRELRANLFAALFLVPRHVLEQELRFAEMRENNVSSLQAIELADTFQVPYKTMVRRLYEIGFIKKQLMTTLWQEQNLPHLRNLLQLEPRYPTAPIIQYEGLIEKTLDLYHKGRISPSRLRNLLSLVQKEPIDFGIELHDFPSEEELTRLLEENGDE